MGDAINGAARKVLLAFKRQETEEEDEQSSMQIRSCEGRRVSAHAGAGCKMNSKETKKNVTDRFHAKKRNYL